MRLATVSTRGWTLENILARSANFYAVPSKNVEHLAADEIEFAVRDFEESGIPLLMQNWHKRPGWNPNLFSPLWLRDNEGDSSPSIYLIFSSFQI
jgi:hypothetical protein